MEDTSYYCMNDFHTSNFYTGAYQDQVNYPFERYDWDCGMNQHMTNWEEKNSMHYDADVPAELINNNFWAWPWFVLLTFCLSGLLWIFGNLIYIPTAIVLSVYNFFEVLYATGLLIFEYPRRLQFGEWVMYPVRRCIVEGLILTIGFFWLLVPGFSVVALPILGFWYAHDFLDYAGWD